MYVRQPSPNESRVKLPDNYGGIAFSKTPYSDMPPPARQSPRPYDTGTAEQNDRPKADVVQKSSPFVEQLRESRNTYTPPAQPEHEQATQQYAALSDEKRQEPTAIIQHSPDNKKEAPSIFSSLLPKGFASGNFPFGHGIGGEELLILGMMLLVYLSGSQKGEVDGEFILLLGLLLFAG